MPDAQSTTTETGFAPCGSRSGPWICAVAHINREIEAETELRRQDYPVYLPQHSVTLSNRQRVIQPLFRRYLFLQPHPDGSWSSARSTRGIAAVLRHVGGAAQLVPESILAALWRQCAANGVIYPPEPKTIAAGDRIRIASGPLADLDGICSRTAKDRVWVLLSILGRAAEVEFPASNLEVYNANRTAL